MAYTNKLHVIYGNGALGVAGDDFYYIFSYERGGLESLKIKGKEWLYRVPTSSRSASGLTWPLAITILWAASSA